MIETLKLLNRQSYSRKHVGSILENVRSKFASSKNESEWEKSHHKHCEGEAGYTRGEMRGRREGEGGVHLWVKSA